jgi:predicted PurR-regulated permease PerM
LTSLFETVLSKLNIAVNVQALMDNALASLQELATPILQNTVSILTSVLSLLGNALLVILLSFFLALDGPRFSKMMFDVIPERMHQETRMFILTTDRAFGGFLRSQILQAVLIGTGTGIILAAFGVQAALLAAVFAGLFMLIPLVGPILSMLPPLLAVVLTDPSKILWVMVPIVVLQVVIVNVLMPRVMGDALGLHPLVIIVSLLIGVKVAGFWGAFFAMPLAGIISAFGAFLIRRRQRLAEWTLSIVQQDGGETGPPGETDLISNLSARGENTAPGEVTHGSSSERL